MKRFSMRVFVLVFACLTSFAICRADELAAVTGLVTDPGGRSVPGVTIIITNLSTSATSRAVTNDQGIYRVPSLQPGIYRMTLDKDGFKSIVKSGVELHVQDVASINFELQIGSVNETVTVEAGGLVINTTDATVSTVVDRQFAENLPMNGRSFQTLIELTPGVVLTSSNYADNGQFSINGQRAESNYWTVDGVSANIGTGASPTAYPGNGLAGAVGSFSAAGGTNSLVSIDALQEFRIQTSTYAPEFGRTPGGQISIATRSGTGKFHGALFDYFRNDVLDANDWFASANRLPKPEERQNDFGGTFSGPILKGRTFFFLSYEGLRLRLPQVVETTVPDLAARQLALPALQPYLNAFPQPNGPAAVDSHGNPVAGAAQFNGSISNKSILDAYSIRIDHRVGEKVSLFGRYNYSPSEIVIRGNGGALSQVTPTSITVQTATVGATWQVSSTTNNDLRFNYSRTATSGRSYLDTFGGAIPVGSLPFPPSDQSDNALFFFDIFSLKQGTFFSGQSVKNLQRQINLVDSVSIQKSSHSLKFGVDFRRLSPTYDPTVYEQAPLFTDLPSAENGHPLVTFVQANLNQKFLFRNLGIYAQDTWRAGPRVTLTYGLRWDVDFVPESLIGPSLPAVTGFTLNNLSNLALAPTGVSPYTTTYGNLAPRIGLAYQLSKNQISPTVLRGGVGVFYDLASSQMGNQVGTNHYPFGSLSGNFGGTFPLDPAEAAPPPIVAPNPSNGATLYAFDPHLRLPYTLEWNVALEQGLGQQQSISASYVGAVGRRLLLTDSVAAPSPNLSSAQLVFNAGTSSYNALQIQFNRRLSRGLQALASYSWSHSIDTGSAGSDAIVSNSFVPSSVGGSNRGSSDFDIRNAFSAGVTYDISALTTDSFRKAILGGWSLQNVILARSASPIDIVDGNFSQFNSGYSGAIRPDLVAGQHVYLFGPQYPGGKAFNSNAFVDPPFDPNTGVPLRQGNVPRNLLRGFGAAEWDLGVHRDFPIRESLHLQFRAELFNVLNHPNFGPPSGQFGAGGFGVSSQMLGQSLGAGNLGGGGLSALYQIGGPRSIQLVLKLVF